jgi:RNA polymerase sigma factor (sigma-70 family)
MEEIERNISLSDFAFGFGMFVIMSETDLQLLTRYTSQHAEDAFTEVVRRHIDLVHSAALRQVRSPELAEEVAQAVFIELSRRARQLPSDTVVGAWLYNQTRRRAIDVVRREAGRRIREQTAQELQAMNATAEDWTHIEPLLDDAMDALDEMDRIAVLLRYFQNKPLREVGQAIGVSDDAAQKRVNRALERLREFFAKRGVTVGASGLVVVISANAVQAAPTDMISIAINALHNVSTSDGSHLLPDWRRSRLFKVGLGLAGIVLIGFVAEFIWRSPVDSKQTNVAVALPQIEARLIQIGGAIKRTTTRPTGIFAFAFKTTARPGEQVTVTNTRSNYRLMIRPAFEQGKIRIDSSLIEDSAPATPVVFPTVRATNGEQVIAAQGIYSFELRPTISGSP